ncbi:branched-chain amino acid transport system ATP-binding protein [Bradyrhizobium macuxiense]|uniref:Branched-chain amino acid transport system ATP-binding protein n=1 Tax=Bradyrhizobium macuxiense TaxID=1755647 RepID=A0A560KXG4_9BRAD|nr:ABC transporter ATP-binding protein [Bradyrhizobium macuxiense]TWB87809.1 branched-chain amino acid transport system ATP-binding protein [Bradyrhizobium macuxiense]
MSKPLSVEALTSGYGDVPILTGLSMRIEAGSSMAVLGRNGVGKTTLLLSILGLITQHSGSITLGDLRLERMLPFRRARSGLALVPQEREIFPSLTVDENLAVAQRHGQWSATDIYELFPPLARRRRNLGDRLSGGEQQMLALGRALVTNPHVLLLDEPFEGLAPVIVDVIVEALQAVRKRSGLTSVLVEHRTDLALEITERAMILDHGAAVWEGASQALALRTDLLASLIGLDATGAETKQGTKHAAV